MNPASELRSLMARLTPWFKPEGWDTVRRRKVLFAAAGLLVLGLACSFVVPERERGIVTRFGKPVRVISEAGLFFRLPWPFEQVIRIDGRLQGTELRISETLTRDRRNIIPHVFFVWKVADPLRFHNSVKTLAKASETLEATVTSARNSVIGRYDFHALVSVDAPSALKDVEHETLEVASRDALELLGVQILSVAVTRLNLPAGNTEAVFRRMRSERLEEASKFQSEGLAEAEKIKADTQKEVSRLLADARAYAEETRGKAEAQAASIYAEAHAKAPEFYGFLRELQSLRSIIDTNTTLVFDTSDAPFRLLKPGNLPVPSEASPPKPLPPALLEDSAHDPLSN